MIKTHKVRDTENIFIVSERAYLHSLQGLKSSRFFELEVPSQAKKWVQGIESNSSNVNKASCASETELQLSTEISLIATMRVVKRLRI